MKKISVRIKEMLVAALEWAESNLWQEDMEASISATGAIKEE